ncbi:uncharacterized protein [Oscarella lobularis]|uniref:uncharacterized protein n=1 Tax=Oscarella lobularis TaxID=121494 RepID=UPI00331309B6
MLFAVLLLFACCNSLSSAQFSAHSLQFGRVEWNSDESDTREYVVPDGCPVSSALPECCPKDLQGPSCKQIVFDRTMRVELDEEVHVQASVSYKDNVDARAFTSWVLHPNARSAYVCMTPSGYAAHDLSLSIEWSAYVSKKANDGEIPTIGNNSRSGFVGDGIIEFGDFTYGRVCENVVVDGTVTTVLITTRLENEERMMQDAVFSWTENVRDNAFTVCVEEMQKFSGVHRDVKVDWIAFDDTSIALLQSRLNVTEADSTTFIVSESSSSLTYRKRVAFTRTYYEKLPPAVFVSPTSKTLDDVVVVWAESVTSTGFDLVLMDGYSQSYRSARSTREVDVSWIVIGYTDPCVGVQCALYGYCEPIGPHSHACVPPNCTEIEAPVCTSDGQTFINECYYRRYLFQTRRTDVRIHHHGSCMPFPFQPGTVTLDSPTTGSQQYACKQIQFNPHFFYPGQRLHALVTPDFRSNDYADFVHDPAVVWIEEFGYENLTICAYVAGRGDRHDMADEHSVTASYMVYQGAPDDGNAGLLTVSHWWTGTLCKSVSLYGFSTVPHVLVSIEHGLNKLKHDAASIWLDSVSVDSFTVCVRELQNFDGLHQHVFINWLAFTTVPYTIFSDYGSALFDVHNALRSNVNDAHCQIIDFTRAYNVAPRILVTAQRNDSVEVSSKYDDVIAWVESVSRLKFRVCVKEFYPDPIKVIYAVMPDACEEPGWFPYDGYCYKPSIECKTHEEAAADCVSQGGHLSSIHSDREAFFVGTLTGQNAWIGLPYEVSNASLDLNRWSDGSAVGYTHWASGYAGGVMLGQCIGTLGPFNRFTWNISDCYDCKSYVCKKDLRACSTGAHNCSQFADCDDEDGGFTCDCRSTHDGDGFTCRADECKLALDDCSSDAHCINTENSYECDCKLGYIGDGKTCDADECALKIDDCHELATCTNIIGSFECTCPIEYKGNGKNCERICPDDWNFFDGHCYKALPPSSTTWQHVVLNCRTLDSRANLVSLNSPYEQNYVNGLTSSSYFIGYNDVDREGAWKWVDGSPSTFSYWRHGEPNNGGYYSSWWRYRYGNEDCTYAEKSDSGRWSDIPCSAYKNYQYVCEIPF